MSSSQELEDIVFKTMKVHGTDREMAARTFDRVSREL